MPHWMRKLLGLVAQQTPETASPPASPAGGAAPGDAAAPPGSAFEIVVEGHCPCCWRPFRCIAISPTKTVLPAGTVIICPRCWYVMMLCDKGHAHIAGAPQLSMCNNRNPAAFAQVLAGQRAWRARELARRKPANFYFGQN